MVETTNSLPILQVVKMLKSEDGPVEIHQISCGRKVIFDGCDLKDSGCTNYLYTMRPT